MNNVHRIGDYNNDNNNRQRQQGQQNDQGFDGQNLNPAFNGQTIRRCEQLRIPFFSGSGKVKNPRNEFYYDFLIQTFCPAIKLCSFTVFIVLVDIAVFIAQVSVGLYRPGALLEVDNSTLVQFKCMYPLAAYDGQGYRLITAIGLHLNFIHIFFNVLATLVLVSRVEHTYKWYWAFPLYIATGIMGNIFTGVCVSDIRSLSAGASTSLLGMIGLLLGYIIINWDGMSFLPSVIRVQMVIMLMMLILISFLLTLGQANIDYFGHLGGFLAGLWLSALPPPIKNQKRQKVLRGIGLSLFAIQALVCFLVFYLGKPGLKYAANLPQRSYPFY